MSGAGAGAVRCWKGTSVLLRVRRAVEWMVSVWNGEWRFFPTALQSNAEVTKGVTTPKRTTSFPTSFQGQQ